MRGGRDDALDFFGVGLGVRRRAGPVDRDIAGSLRPDLRCARANGLAQIDRGGALLVLDGDELGGVLRGGERLGDHNGNGLAHMAHGRAGKRGAVRNDELLSAAAGKRRVLRHVADAFHVGGGEHADDARRGLGRGGVDRTNVG